MKKILLIPTYHYLSNPIYSSMKELLQDKCKFIYFFPKDSVSIKANLENITFKKVGRNFDQYIELDFEPIWVKRIKKREEKELKLKKNYIKKTIDLTQKILRRLIKTPLSTYKIYQDYTTYINKFNKIIKKVGPDYIIITSDMTLNYRIIKKYFPEIKVIVIQPCFLDFRERVLNNITFKRKTLNFLLKGIFLPKQPYFGLENDKNDKLLLFEEKILSFYQNKRENIYKIVNPFFCKLNDQIEHLDKTKIKQKLSNIIDIDLKREIIIIYISDYTSFHGEKVQRYTEQTYIKLINEFSDKFSFIIKNHPRAGVKNFEKHFIDYAQVFFLNNEIKYEELLAIGDLNISINSNASLESIVCGMPTINFLPLHLKENDHFKLLSYYGGIEAYTYEDLDRLLNDFIKNKKSFIRELEKNRKKLVGSKEECRESLLKILGN